MNLSRIFIERPVMTALVCFAILLFGTIAFRALPVAALPSVDYPTIQVSAAVPGASPETMASSVATPLEREFSTIAGIQSMNSTNTLGSTSITVQFTLDRKIDAAAQDIQAAIARAGGRLPPSMPRPPSYQKVNPAEQPVFYLALDSATLPHVHRRRIRRYPAGAAHLHGQRRLARAGLRRAEVRRARAGGPRQAGRARHRHRRSAAAPSPAATPICPPAGWMATSRRSPSNPAASLSNAAGLPAHHRGLAQRHARCAWKQLGNVIDSVENDKIVAWYNNKRAVILAIQRQPGTNTVEVVDSIKKLLPQFRKEIPPAVNLSIAFDASQSIRGSIRDVEFTLVLTICVVVLVIFLFLRNLSATLIPGCAVPFSIVGTFAVMYLLGYSLNNLSLMALTLSVGFVVDDAIVMLENIVRHMEMGEAAHAGGAQRIARNRLHHSLHDHSRWWPCSSRCCSWAASWAACCTSFPSPSWSPF